MNNWISVDERLPEIDHTKRGIGDSVIQVSTRVLCVCKQQSGKVMVKEGYYETGKWGLTWRIPGSIDSVTHWMYLPKPPIEEADDETNN